MCLDGCWLFGGGGVSIAGWIHDTHLSMLINLRQQICQSHVWGGRLYCTGTLSTSHYYFHFISFVHGLRDCGHFSFFLSWHSLMASIMCWSLLYRLLDSQIEESIEMLPIQCTLITSLLWFMEINRPRVASGQMSEFTKLKLYLSKGDKFNMKLVNFKRIKRRRKRL